MITKEQAVAIVTAELKKLESPSLPLTINESVTIERPYGWVFYCNSRKFFETGDFKYRVFNLTSILVNRETGAVTKARQNQTMEAFIEEYENGA